MFHFLGLFLFFISSTYCSLIPNNWVTTDWPEDSNLVEGITYNIVHFYSKLNLVSDVDNKVFVSASNDSNRYQCWSLQRVKNNLYNIINVGSSMNLDSDNHNVYIGTYGNDNPHQYWTFKKVNDSIYNIARLSKSLNLDSNGKIVYMSIFNKDNIYQQWLFEPSNYKLNTLVTDYTLDFEKNRTDRNETQINLVNGDNTIDNPTDAAIEEIIDRTEKKSCSYTIEIRKSRSFNLGLHVGMSFSIDKNFCNILSILGVKASLDLGIKGEFGETNEEINKQTISEEVSYHIQHKIIVPANTSVAVDAIVNKVYFVIPFKAKIRITGVADRLDVNGKIVSNASVDNNAIRYYLQRENYGDERIMFEEGYFYVNTSGTLGIDGYGYNSTIKAKTLENKPSENPEPSSKFPIPSSKNSESPSKNPVIFYYITLTLLQIIIQQI